MIDDKFLKTKNIGFYKTLLITINTISLTTVIILYNLMSQPDIINQSLSESDLKQAMAIISSTIGIGIVIIGFLFWTISIIYRNIYESRKTSNINLRLIGLTKGGLIKIYLMEFLKLFPISLIGAIGLNYIISNILKVLYGIQNTHMSINKILFILIYLLVVTTVVLITLLQLPAKNIIDEIRTDYKIDRKERSVSVTKLIISMILFFGVYFFANSIHNRYSNLAKLLYFIPYLLIIGEVIYLIDQLIIKVVKKIKLNFLTLSMKLSSKNFKSKMMKFHFLVIALVLFLGLNMLFNNVRFAAGNIVDENINFNYYETLEFGSHNQEAGKNTNVSSSIVATLGSSNVTVSGVDATYFSNVEEIATYDQEISKLKDNFSDPEWRGIIIPDYYISENDIGSEIIIKYKGVDIPFIVASSYKSNDISKLNCFVSQGYLNSSLGMDKNDFNRIYMFDSGHLDGNVKKTDIVTKENIKENSIQKAVQGTDAVEIIALVVLVTSIIFFSNLISLEAQKNIIEMAKLRIMGFGKLKVYFIYIFNNFITITQTFLVVSGLSIGFAKIVSYTIIGEAYFHNSFIFDMKNFLLLYIFLLILSILVTVFRTIDIMKDRHLEYIRGFE